MLTATNRRFRLLPAFALVAGLLVVTQNAVAQHWRLFCTSNSGNFYSGFFFDIRTGFLGSAGPQGVYKTTDAGAHWKTAQMTPAPSGSAVIRDIRMTDRQNGWLALESNFVTVGTTTTYGPGVYRTTDGGDNWFATTYTREGASIWQTSKAVVVTNRGIGHGGGLSLDGGATFQYLRATDSCVGMAFVDDKHGVIAGYHDTAWSVTNDGGVTWQHIFGTFNRESWGLYGVQGTPTFYAAGENDWDDLTKLPSSSWKSTDYGVTWSKLSNLAIRTTGQICGIGDTVLYVQCCLKSAVQQGGMWRSTDHGRVWMPVGGPITQEDRRFIVLGCRGEIVIAFDDAHNALITTDGGDGAFSQASLSSFSTLKVDSIDLCSVRDTVIPIKNLTCDTIFITNATAPPMPPLTILDPNGGAPKFPYAIGPGETGSVRVRLSSLLAGTYSTRLIIEISSGGTDFYDTVLITSATRFTNPVYASAKSLTFDSTMLCSVTDSSIVLSNDSCFTVQIVSSAMKSGTNFTLLKTIANDSIPSGTKKYFTVRFEPTAPGAVNDSLIVNLMVLGKPDRMAFAMKGIGLPDAPRFIMLLSYMRTKADSIDFGTRTTCSPDSLIPYLITNPGCSAVNVSMQIFDSTKSQLPPNDVIKWLVKPGTFRVFHGTHTQPNDVDTITGGILVHAGRRGVFHGYLRVVHWIDGQKPDTTDLPFRVNIENGSKTLSMDASTRDLDTIPFCKEADIVIPIENLGCDTLFVDSLSISGPGFSLTNKPAVPVLLQDIGHAPGNQRKLTVHFAPTQAGLSTGVLTVRTDADSAPLRTVNFRAFVLPTDTVRIGAMSARASVHVGDTSVISIIPNKTFKTKNISTIDLTLEYNGDVMEALGAPAPGGTNTTATADPEAHTIGRTVQRNIYIVGANISIDSGQPIVSQQFGFYLTDTALTNFRLAKLVFNKGDAVFAKCTLGEVADTGTISVGFYCGDSLIYRLMHDGTDFRLEQGIAPSTRKVRPNPVANGMVSLPFRALRATDVELLLTNEAGQQISTLRSNVSAIGEQSFDVNTSTLPKGVYHYMLRAADNGQGTASGEFVVMK